MGTRARRVSRRATSVIRTARGLPCRNPATRTCRRHRRDDEIRSARRRAVRNSVLRATMKCGSCQRHLPEKQWEAAATAAAAAAGEAVRYPRHPCSRGCHGRRGPLLHLSRHSRRRLRAPAAQRRRRRRRTTCCCRRGCQRPRRRRRGPRERSPQRRRSQTAGTMVNEAGQGQAQLER